MALAIKDLALLTRLASRGDTYSRGILEALKGEQGAGGGRLEKILAAPATAGTTDAMTAKAANLADNNLAIADASPDFPRNVIATFGATWDGGDITIVGTDHTGANVTEVLADNPNGTTEGNVAWKTITSVTKQAVGAAVGTVSLGYSTKLGVGGKGLVAGSSLCYVDGVASAHTFNATYGTIVPGSAPNGARNYILSAVKA